MWALSFSGRRHARVMPATYACPVETSLEGHVRTHAKRNTRAQPNAAPGTVRVQCLRQGARSRCLLRYMIQALAFQKRPPRPCSGRFAPRRQLDPRSEEGERPPCRISTRFGRADASRRHYAPARRGGLEVDRTRCADAPVNPGPQASPARSDLRVRSVVQHPRPEVLSDSLACSQQSPQAVLHCHPHRTHPFVIGANECLSMDLGHADRAPRTISPSRHESPRSRSR